MANIPRDIIDAIRDRVDLVELIGRHVTLTRRGKAIVGLCPFHQEKTPSFNVIEHKKIFHCFGCQQGGDCFKFVMMIEGLSFFQAAKELGESVGITVEEKELSPAERKALKQRATMFDVLESAARLYESWLWTGPAGAAARAYLEGRGITPETARAARLGWAPEGWTRLVDALHREGYDGEQVAETGLCKARERGNGHFDFLRERLIIPIRDERNRVVAFGGRTLGGDEPKYLNTPETRLYEKSSVLYGLETARNAIQQKHRVIVVEGYFDVISLQQAGFREAVATCGTALTPAHLDKIRRYARDVVLLMDADQAGLRAAERALPLFVHAGIQPWRLDLPGAKDPDELVREGGPDALERALAAKEPLFEWVVQRKLDAYGIDHGSRDRVLEEIGPMLADFGDTTLTSRVAARLGMNEELFRKRLRELPRRKAEDPAVPPPPATAWKPERDVNHVLWLLVHRYGEVADVLARIPPDVLGLHPAVRPVVARLLSGEPVAAVLPEVADPGVQRALQAVVARLELYEAETAARSLLQIVARLTEPLRIAAMSAVKGRIEKAETAGDAEAMLAALREKKALHASDRALAEALEAGDVDGVLQNLVSKGPGV